MPSQCYKCIADAGYSDPESYDFATERSNSPNNNCWDECIGNNTFLNTGDTDQDPVFSWAFFEAEVFHDLSLSGQPPGAYRLPKSNNVDLQVTQTFNRSLELVVVSNADVYSFIDGSIVHIGATGVPYVHGCWFRDYTNPSGNEWISPFHYRPAIPNPFNNWPLNSRTCFTWIASKDGVTGKFGTLNEQYYIDQAGIVCPNVTECPFQTTLSPTKPPTRPPTPFTSTAAPTTKTLPIINFTGIPCQTGDMDLFVIVDASKSISDDSFQREKLWVQQLFARIRREYDRMNAAMAAQGFPDRYCFRAGIITFSYLIAMPMNFSTWDCKSGGYDIATGNSIISTIGRPHTAITALQEHNSRCLGRCAVDV
ncbi:hypothetical protein RFI_05456 [Reticulomyxa filosa]|uniref:VWFA domain-containing protein n=1 Tax=Reticulomyxa filosa TaxID=46433 RepID=X6P278_RETFI|nr:hypothetical protein RFI_05456 [Reticulomyxa filosa]|eukprot:ETO31662.1 hypothetical protein RFI_05456 [Reticulomyxa filosa]